LYVGLADLDRELNDLPGAESHLETAEILAERAFLTENRHRWPLVSAQVRAVYGDHEAAMRLFEQAAALYRHGFYPDVRPIGATQARVQIAIGDLESAAVWVRERGLSVDDDPAYWHEYEHLTRARLLLAQAGAGPLSEEAQTAWPLSTVHTLLGRLHDAAAGAGRSGACWRSGCSRPWPTMSAATLTRRSSSSVSRCRRTRARRPRPVVPR
jgi:LuxR family maltose regulon positive regulatory protein